MDYIKINKALWNDKTDTHFESDFYDVQGFLNGKDSLNPIEIDLLGNIKDKEVLHLQCHFGMDSLSLARRGAQVSGVDFSEKAIEKAQLLNRQLGLDVQFIQSDIFKLHHKLNQQFDLIFTSYGVLGWLPDMQRWADTVQHFLKPGGQLILVEFHPVVWMFDDYFEKISFNYMGGAAIVEQIEGTYTDRSAAIGGQSVSWNHGLSTVVQALLQAGMQVRDFQEYNYSPYDCFENTVQMAANKYQIKGLENKIPMVYSLVAQKSAT